MPAFLFAGAEMKWHSAYLMLSPKPINAGTDHNGDGKTIGLRAELVGQLKTMRFELVADAQTLSREEPASLINNRKVESRCDAVVLGLTYLFPALSFAGDSLFRPCPVFTPRSSNRACRFAAPGSLGNITISPTKSCASALLAG